MKLDLEALTLPVGGILLARADRILSTEQAHRMRDHFRTVLERSGRSDCIVLIADGSVSVEALDDAQLARLGLMRIPRET